MIDHDQVAQRVVAAIGEKGARELLDVLGRPEEDRAALIARLHVRADGDWLAEVSMDLEEDEVARLHLIHALETFKQS